ncbi:MAG: PDZ domain-containing protein [Opitutaceae bacterium]
MKKNILLPYFASALTLAMAVSAASAQQETRRVPAPSGDQRLKAEADMRRPAPFPREKEIVTFLGVETAPVSETLGSQLGLPKESGLVVIHVVPESPAASALKQHDVLVKLDDQILVDPRQFSVLVRNHKEGDEVVFSYIRAGKTATAKVKLAKHEVPKMSAIMFGEGGSRPGTFDVLVNNPNGAPGSREDTDRVLKLLQRGAGPGGGEFRGSAGVGVGGGSQQPWVTREPRRDGQELRATNVNPGNSSMLFTDEQGSLDLTIKDGKKTLVAKNPKGEQIFSGPVNSPEERNALPPEVRGRLDRLEGMQDFTFRTGEAFVPSARTIRAVPQGITFPLSEKGAQEVREPRQIF